MSASIGIAFTGQDIEAPEELLRDADLAMYRSKRDRVGGRDVLDLRQLHLAGHQAGPGARAARRDRTRGAAPRLSADRRRRRWARDRCRGAAALDASSRGPVAPTVFIPFAEQSGQIIELGRWVLEQACADRHHWQRTHRRRSRCRSTSPRISSCPPGSRRPSQAMLASTSTDPALLTLEVTESVFVRDEERALVVLAELKEIGVKLALDDFGTGYSSLGYLNTLPIDTIKVDQTFIAKLDRKPGSQAIVTAIIGLAHSIGMTVVSEGVETAQQHEQVTKLGTDSCQGFYFARPMLASSVDDLIHRAAGGGNPHLPAASTSTPLTAETTPAAQS